MLISVNAQSIPKMDDWIQVDTENLSFSTNLTPQEAQDLTKELLGFMSFSKTFLPRRNEYSIPLRLIIFDEKKDFDKVVRPEKFASFTHSNLGGVLIVAAPSSKNNNDLLENLKHELSHYQMRHASVNYPLWYEEGMATMLSTAELSISKDTLIAEFITPKPSARFPLNQSTRPIRQSWLVKHLKRKHLNNLNLRIIHNFYNDSHRLAHLFHFNTTQDERFSLNSLKHYLQDQSDSLFASLKVTPKELMNTLQKHQNETNGQRNSSVSVPTSDLQPSISTLSKKEVRKLFSVAATTTNPKAAIDLLRQATTIEPTDFLSMLELAELYATANKSKKSKSYLSKAKKLGRNDPRIKIAEASMSIRSCAPATNNCKDYWSKAAHLIREALDIEPDNVEAIYSLGVIELYSGRPGTALNYLKVAQNQAPWSPRINFHLGEALRLLGNPTGRAHLIKARNWSNSDVWRELAEKSISEYK